MSGAANLTPGKKARGGTSVRLSAYLDPDALRMLRVARAFLSGPALARAIGDALPGILADHGIYEVSCPRCGAVSIEAQVKPSRRRADHWRCPQCGGSAHFMEWQHAATSSAPV